jgi:hypothetical protein
MWFSISYRIHYCYRLGGPGIKSRRGWDFPHLSRLSLGPTHPPIQWLLSLSQGVKHLGCGTDHPLPSSLKVKERVELYFYSSSGPSWPVLGWNFPLL